MTVRQFAALVLGCALCGPALAGAPAAAADPAKIVEIPAAPAADPAPAVTPALAGVAQTRVQTAPVLPQPAPVQPMGAAGAASLLQTIFALIIVLGALAAFAWFMKRFGPRASGGAAGLKIVGALNLGGRERILVVEVGKQWVVVGASPGRINALATMERQELEPGQSALDASPASGTSFAEWLKQTIDKRNAK